MHWANARNRASAKTAAPASDGITEKLSHHTNQQSGHFPESNTQEMEHSPTFSTIRTSYSTHSAHKPTSNAPDGAADHKNLADAYASHERRLSTSSGTKHHYRGPRSEGGSSNGRHSASSQPRYTNHQQQHNSVLTNQNLHNLQIDPLQRNGTPKPTSAVGSVHSGSYQNQRRSVTNSMSHISTLPHSQPSQKREAVAISGAHTAAANAANTGMFQTGTRTTFTTPGWHATAGTAGLTGNAAGGGIGVIGLAGVTAAAGVNGLVGNSLTALLARNASGTMGNASSSAFAAQQQPASQGPPTQGVTSAYGSAHGAQPAIAPGGGSGPGMDTAEEELFSLFRELQSAVGHTNVDEILVDLIATIEIRSLASLDPISRDMFVEHRIRDLLSELRRMETEESLLLSTHIIELLLPIDYTSPSHKFIRLCRCLSSIMQGPLDAPRKEAQRVYGLMLEYDSKFTNDPPLKAYLSKDIREQIGIANLHLQARTVNNRKQFPTQLLYFVMSIEEIAKVSPRYISSPASLRDDIIRIATACCVSEPQLEAAAYQCLVAFFKSCSLLNPKDIIRENKMVCSKCEILNSARFNEASVICQLKVLRALFTSRPTVLSGDKSKISAAVTAQFAPSKSPEVRMAVCDLLPIIAPWDIQNPSRRNAYCAFIMEPVKNVRDNRRKSEELTNIAHFIKAVGYHVLDAASRNNLDSILIRYIAVPDVQEACWRVIAAMISKMNSIIPLESRRSNGTIQSQSNTGMYSSVVYGSINGRSGSHPYISPPNHAQIGSLPTVGPGGNEDGQQLISTTPVTADRSTSLQGYQFQKTQSNTSSHMSNSPVGSAPTSPAGHFHPTEEDSVNPVPGGPVSHHVSNAPAGGSSGGNSGTPVTNGPARPRRRSIINRTPRVTTPIVNHGNGESGMPLPPHRGSAYNTGDVIKASTSAGDADGRGSAGLSQNSSFPANAEQIVVPNIDDFPNTENDTASIYSGGSVNQALSGSRAPPRFPVHAVRSGSSPTLSTHGSGSARLMNYTMEDLLSRCIPFIRKGQLTADLVKLLEEVWEALPNLEKPIRAELHELVDTTLKEAAQAEKLQQHQGGARQTVHGNTSGNGAPTSPSSTLHSVFSGPSMMPVSSFHMAVAASTLPRQPGAIGSSRFLNPKDGMTSIVHMSSFTTANQSVHLNSSTGMTSTRGSSVQGIATGGSDSASDRPVSGSPTVKSSAIMQPITPNSNGEPIGLMNLATNNVVQPAPKERKNDLSVALDLISRRDVTAISQLEELAATISPFQRHSDPSVRVNVCRALIRGMASWIRYAKERRESTNSSVIISLLEVYIKNIPIELNSNCRQEAVTLLATTEIFQPYLSDSRVLTVLHGFLSSTPRTREIAVALLHSITHNVKTSALIQQELGVTVDASVMVLEYSDDVQMLIRGMEDLRSYTKLGVRFLTGHLTRIFRALQKRLVDSAVPEMIALCALKTLECVLNAVNKDERAIFRYEDDIMLMYPVAVNILCRNSSHAISLAAIDVLVALNRMITYPAQVVDHQTLMQVLTNVYIATNSTRKEVVNILTLFGQLGAVDPSSPDVHAPPPKQASRFQYSTNGSASAVKVPSIAAQDAHVATRIQPSTQESSTFDAASQDYTVIVYKTLSQLVASAHSEAVCTQALRTLLQFIRFTHDKKDHVDGVMAAHFLIQIAKRNNESPTLRIEALRVLAAICGLRHDKIVRNMLPEIVVLLEQLWAPTDYPLFSVILDVVSALKPGKLSEKEHSESWEWLYPRLMDVAVQDKSDTRELCLRVVEIVLTASYIPAHCLPIIFPVLQRFMQQSGQLVEVRSQSLCAAVHLVCDLKASQYTSSLMLGIRTITRHCELREDLGPRFATVGMLESLKVLSALLPSARLTIRQLLEHLSPKNDPQSDRIKSTSPPPGMGMGSTASTFAVNLFSAAQSSSPGHPSSQVNTGGRSSLRQADEHRLSDEEEEEPNLAVPDVMPTPNAQDIAVFLKHIEWGATRKKMREWFAELQKYIILVSPHPAIRMMADLVSKHDPIRRELFNPSFKAIYEVLSAEQIRKVNMVMSTVLNGNDNELTSQCLALSDYLDHNPPKISPEVLEDLKNLETLELDGAHVAKSSGDTSQLIPQLPSFGVRPGAFPMFPTPFATPVPSSALEVNQVQVMVGGNATAPHEGNTMGTHTSGRESFATISTSDFKSVSPSPTPRLTVGGIETNTSEAFGQVSPNPQGAFSRRITDPAVSGYFFEVSESLRDSPSNLHGQALHYLSPTGRMPISTSQTTKINLFTPQQIIKAVERTRLYDKAFNYFESRLLEATKVYAFNKMPWDVVHSVVLPLAWLYNKRDMRNSVIGLFDAIQYKGETDAGRGYELLGSWEDAQRVYAKAFSDHLTSSTPLPLRVVEGYIRSLFFSAEWSKALEVSLTLSTESLRSSLTISRCGSTAAWVLGRWDDMLSLSTPTLGSERSATSLQQLFSHVYQLRKAVVSNDMKEFEALRTVISHAKLSMDESVRTLLPLSYNHAYDHLAILQHYTEIEELIDYCTSKQQKRQSQLLQRWEKRFQKMKSGAPQPTLNTLLILSVVLPTTEMSSMILNFCEAMSGEYPKLTQWAMNWLQDGVLPSSTHSFSLTRPAFINSNPEVNVGYISHMWSQGRREDAIEEMEHFLNENRTALEKKWSAVYAAAELRLGKWKQEMLGDKRWSRENVEEEFGHFYRAIRADPSSYEAWHSWALINYRVQQRQETMEDQRRYVEAAHQGFAAAICRCQCPADALPAIMRLLQLWVIHNGVALLKEMVADIISRIPVDYWVQAIPQLIGHLTNESYDIREVISMILRLLCEKHPQAVIFPLLVVNMSDEENNHGTPTTTVSSANLSAQVGPQSRKKELVRSIIQHCPKQVRVEAETVAKLLVDVSAIPIEKIREHLSEVAAAWNPNTEFEVDREEVGRRLRSALEIFNINRRHLLYTVGDIGQFVQIVLEHDAAGDTAKALGIVKQLVEEISKHVSEKLGKEPQRAMEPLLRLRNLSIAVFGEYDISGADGCFPTITSFSSILEVIPSKKRPRKIQLSGSDGKLYTYCLKGNEDIRMDERVMQLFGMVNVLLQHARVGGASTIHRFPVIPISASVGLLGWVQKASTINSIICDYRMNVSQMRAHQESSVLRNYVETIGQWEKMTIIQRTEALDYVMHTPSCSAMDVANAMWFCANTAEQWLDRRSTYAASLATMSMVGYVLGLGDRHLGNILLSMTTGKAIHIDFGDSFEVGRLRHVLPETIPFRLTRMLANAMEVFGVNGSFRSSATKTQQILRLERDSIMSLLSAFVYDPIVQHKGKVKSIMEKSRSPQDIVERIRRKLHGTELAVANDTLTLYQTTPESSRRPDLLYMSKVFDAVAPRVSSMGFSTEKQVNFLIDEATRVDNYTVLFVGWGPLW